MSELRIKYHEQFHTDDNYPTGTFENWLLQKLERQEGELQKLKEGLIRKIKFGEDGRCDCTQADVCPNGKIASQERCFKDELLNQKNETRG